MNDQPFSELSQSGLARRQRMHDELIEAMTKLHRRRHVRRRTLVAAVLLLPLLFGALVLVKPSAAPPALPTIVEGEPRLPHPQPGDARPSLVQVVHTDPSVIDRYAYSASDSTVTWIDDQQLLQELAALGRPAGIVRMNGRAWLTMDVTDDVQDEREEVHTPSSSIVPSPDSAEPRRSAAGRQAATAPRQI